MYMKHFSIFFILFIVILLSSFYNLSYHESFINPSNISIQHKQLNLQFISDFKQLLSSQAESPQENTHTVEQFIQKINSIDIIYYAKIENLTSNQPTIPDSLCPELLNSSNPISLHSFFTKQILSQDNPEPFSILHEIFLSLYQSKQYIMNHEQRNDFISNKESKYKSILQKLFLICIFYKIKTENDDSLLNHIFISYFPENTFTPPYHFSQILSFFFNDLPNHVYSSFITFYKELFISYFQKKIPYPKPNEFKNINIYPKNSIKELGDDLFIQMNDIKDKLIYLNSNKNEDDIKLFTEKLNHNIFIFYVSKTLFFIEFMNHLHETMGISYHSTNEDIRTVQSSKELYYSLMSQYDTSYE